jgi:hypothetical protein
MLWLGYWQLHRAESGNELSWAYTFEWPLFASFGVYFWAKSLRDEMRLDAGQPADASGRLASEAGGQASGADAGISSVDADHLGDEAAVATAYLTRLKAEVQGHGKWHGWR